MSLRSQAAPTHQPLPAGLETFLWKLPNLTKADRPSGNSEQRSLAVLCCAVLCCAVLWCLQIQRVEAEQHLLAKFLLQLDRTAAVWRQVGRLVH